MYLYLICNNLCYLRPSWKPASAVGVSVEKKSFYLLTYNVRWLLTYVYVCVRTCTYVYVRVRTNLYVLICTYDSARTNLYVRCSL